VRRYRNGIGFDRWPHMFGHGSWQVVGEGTWSVIAIVKVSVKVSNVETFFRVSAI
jgi:hypothetical protein